jgi:type VI secretion system protein ImpC
MTEGVSVARVDELIALLDARIGSVVDEVLHHPRYQALEAAWRGIAYVVDRVAFEQNIRVEICHIPQVDLREDLSSSPELPRSWLFRTVYASEYGQFGGTPYAAMFLDFAITSSADDVAMLRALAAVAAMAHAPVFLAAHPSLLHLASFNDLPFATDLTSAFEGPSSLAWNSFATTEDSRYVGVLLPRMLLRPPHRDAVNPASKFVYDESVTGSTDMLWGSATYAFAVRLADVFATHRSYLGMLDETVGDNPPVLEMHPALEADAPKPGVEVVLSARIEHLLSELGFVPLGYDLFRSKLRFRRAPSLQRPRTFGSSEGGQAATLNFLLGTQFPYSLLASRFAHYLKVIERERIGASATRADAERELNEWLRQFVVALDGASAATRLKYPLRAARVRLADVEGQAGWYRMEVHLQPHMKYLGHAVVLSVAGRMEAR